MKTKIDSFDDIIFENRNKEYGAYELRRKYPKRGAFALVIALIIVFIVGGPLIAGMINQNNKPVDLDSLGPNIEFTTLQKEEPVPLPKYPHQNQKEKPPFFLTPVIVDELTEPGFELVSVDVLKGHVNSGNFDTAFRDLNSQKDENFIPENDDSEHPIYEIKEKPIFPGGDKELFKFLALNIKYPASAQEKNIEGTVYIRFVVTKTGDVGKVTLVRSIDPLLDDEALRVVKALPKWTPGKNNGNPVNVWFIIPVKFQLQ